MMHNDDPRRTREMAAQFALIKLAAIVVFSVVAVILLAVYWPWKSIIADPGHEVVLVDRPYFAGHEGVRPETLKEGRGYYWNTTTGISVATTPMVTPVKFDDIPSADGVLLDFESTIQWQLLDPADTIRNFGPNWFVNVVLGQYQQIVTREIKLYSMREIMSDAKVFDKIDKNITASTLKILRESGLKVRFNNITLGRAKPNAKVLLQMDETAARQQRLVTLDAEIENEKKRTQRETQRAIADLAYSQGMGLSTSQFVQLDQVRMYSEACAKSGHCIVTTGQAPLVLPTTPVAK